MSAPVISFSHVRKIFARGKDAVTAIDDLSFEIAPGEYVSMLGRSGCGKSTTVNILLGVTGVTSGHASVLGVDPQRDFDRLKGRIACVFQADRLLPWRTALDNVRLPLEILHIDERQLAIRPEDWLERVGLQAAAKAYPHELSGGMRQRVALARALASNPDIVLADESFGHLDEVTGRQLREDFHDLVKTTGKTVLHITHSIDEGISLGDRMLVLGRPGRLLATFPGGRSSTPRQRERLRDEVFRRLSAVDGVAVSPEIAAEAMV